MAMRYCQWSLDAEAEMINVTVVKRALWIVLFIFSGYVLLTDYGYYRHSIRDSGIVSAVRYTSSIDSYMQGDCGGRRICSDVYAYDITWWKDDKSYVYHAAKELESPPKVICMRVVQNNPAIAKPCDAFFFNASLTPFLIAIWASVAFMSLTLFIHHKLHPDSLPVRASWRIINRLHQVLLETYDQEEALQFIKKGYRICATTRSRQIILVGRKKVINDCTHYFVRVRKTTGR